MRARRDRTARPTAARRRTLVPAAIVVTLAGACATRAEEPPLADGGPAAEETPTTAAGAPDPTPEVEETVRYLEGVRDRSVAEPYRFEMSMSMRAVGPQPGDLLDIEAPVMSGEQDGARSEIHMDMGPLIEEMTSDLGEPGPPAGFDLSMDMVQDAQTLYLRAPYFATLLEEVPPGTDRGPVEDLAVIADQWGRIDLTQLGGFSVGELSQTMGGPGGSDPRVLLETVAGAEDVENLGAETIDGTPVEGVGARLSMGDLLAAEGVDPEDFVNQLAAGMGGGPGIDAEAAAERMLASEIPFEVWVDGDSYMRRLSYEMDLSALVPTIDSGIGAGRPEEFTMGMTMDFWDHADAGIAVDVPTDALDVTEAYHALLRANAAAAAAAAGDPQGS